MKKIQRFIIIVLVALSALSSVAHYAQAQTSKTGPQGIREYQLLEPLPNINTPNAPVIKTVTFIYYIGLMYKLAIALAAVFAIFWIAVGGFEYMISSDSVYKKGDGLAKVKSAISGLLLALISWLLLYTINPKLVEFNDNFITPIAVNSSGLNELNADIAASEQTIRLGEEAKKAHGDYDKGVALGADLAKQADDAALEGDLDRASELLNASNAAYQNAHETWLDQNIKDEYTRATAVNTVSETEEFRRRMDASYEQGIANLTKYQDFEAVKAAEQDKVLKDIELMTKETTLKLNPDSVPLITLESGEKVPDNESLVDITSAKKEMNALANQAAQKYAADAEFIKKLNDAKIASTRQVTAACATAQKNAANEVRCK